MSVQQEKPDAIVFIPGIGEPWKGDLVEGFGDRFQAVLEHTPDGGKP